MRESKADKADGLIPYSHAGTGGSLVPSGVMPFGCSRPEKFCRFGIVFIQREGLLGTGDNLPSTRNVSRDWMFENIGVARCITPVDLTPLDCDVLIQGMGLLVVQKQMSVVRLNVDIDLCQNFAQELI